MSSETAGPGRSPASSKGARSLFAIVVSTPSTHTLRAERLDASTVLLVSSGRTITPLANWLEAFSVSPVHASGSPAGARGAAAADIAADLELLPAPARRRKDV